MSGLEASRWASTPVPEEKKMVAEQEKVEIDVTHSQVEGPVKEGGKSVSTDEPNAKVIEEKETDKAASASTLEEVAKGSTTTVDDTPRLEPTPQKAERLSWAEDVEEAETGLQGAPSTATETKIVQQVDTSHEKDDFPTAPTPTLQITADAAKPIESSDVQATESPATTQPFRLEPPRLKKRVSWRGKNCMINIPSLDFIALGLPIPMTLEEARERIAYFDAAMDEASVNKLDETSAHVRPIFPDEQEIRRWKAGNKAIVSLPDLNALKNEQDAIIEARLAALGVGSVSDSVGSLQSEDMSRQTSSTYPTTFSPPLPTSSANGIRPAFVRGHSHTMSVASPITPGSGPFGHMHRHSTFHGFSPLQAQDLSRQSFSPSSPFNMPPIPTVASPAQLAMLRQEFGHARGPGSPLSQSITPELIDPQRQSLQNLIHQPPLPSNQFLQRGLVEPVSALPALPEDEDEEELSDPVPYMPPHKRAQINEDIVVPTPRHRHNISEGLEREVLQAEQRHEADERGSNGRLGSFGQAPKLFGQVSDQVPAEKDPLSGDYSVLESGHNHKRSGSRFNFTAVPSFTFNPAATFNPGSSSFTFGGAAKRAGTNGHTRRVSSGTFNVAAPEFKPSASLEGPAPPSSDFSFASQGPDFNAVAPTFVPPVLPAGNAIEQLPSIFGKIDIPDIVKPAKKSKAITIVRPSDASNISISATDAEDSEGRPIRSDERQKRSRKTGGDSGDEVPQFAVPSPVPLPEAPLLPSQPAESFPVQETASSQTSQSQTANNDLVKGETSRNAESSPLKHKQNNSSLSALAQPWQPGNSLQSNGDLLRSDASGSEEGEVRDENEAPVNRSPDFQAVREPPAPVAAVYPSFDEIDAVMQQLNDDAEGEEKPMQAGTFSPQPGVQYLSQWPPRSDAPSPSPKRQQKQYQYSPTKQNGILDRDNRLAGDVWSEVNRIPKKSGPPSDWSDMLTPADDGKLQARSSFFDSRIDDVVGRVLADRLRPFEDALQNIQLTLRKNTPTERRFSKHRGSSAIDSDADDDDSDAPRHRPVSRGRDDKLGHIKAVVLEALREQSPQRSQSTYDMADLHGALADMKMSFARAASSGLELDDIRAIVEDAVARQPPAAQLQHAEDLDNAAHKQQLTELEGRLNETLTKALEQANRMHDVEQREAETRRMLKLAEEEIRLLREDNDDGSTRSRVFESERTTLLEKLDEARGAQAKAEDHSDNLKAEVDAMQSTLEEYRESSKRWRQAAEEHKIERESLQNTVQTLERHLQDTQDSGSGIKRRLENLHADLATASEQLISEKSRWKAREDTMRAQCEALELQLAQSAREKLQHQEEVRALQISAAEVDEAKQAFEGLHTTNASLDGMIRGLRADLQASQALASQFEHDFKEASESGRVEVQRVRLVMELEVEAANHKTALMRAELEGETARVRAELDSVRLEADTAKEKHALLLQEEAETRNTHIQKLQKTSSVGLDEARLKYEGAIRDLTQQHSRSFAHAIEDKERSEYLLNERLALADAKLQHYQDRITHLEERVEIAKSAAQAAATSAKGSKVIAAPISRSLAPPEKISPQALRESILVLQEQLQDRELRVEKLQQTLKTNGPAKIKERDTEISWLRELLTVRGEELTELINSLAEPSFDRAAVRDAAIRIRANLDMERQEKERTATTPLTASQALTNLSNFATPKAAQLSSAFNKWRASMESTALKSRTPSGSAYRSNTPSRAPSATKGTFDMSGLMTPPTSNLRSSPSPEATTTVPPPKLTARRESKSQKFDPETLSPAEEPPSTPNLFGTSHYDDDAEDRAGEMPELDDDDLNIADSQPPAFRSLEDELSEPVEAGAEE